MSLGTAGRGAAAADAGWMPPGLARAAAIAVVLAAVVLLGYFQVNDGDVFWQLEVGERVLATGDTVDQRNAFSSLFPDHPYYNSEWLFQALLAEVHARGGWPGVMALKLALAALVAGTLLLRLLAVRDAPATAAALTLVALATIRERLTERPQLASLVLFGLMLLLLEGSRRGRTRLLWGLPPLFALWSNVHGELLLGVLVLFGAAAGGWLQRRGAGDQGAVAPGRLAALGAACLCASLLNPGGARILLHPFGHFSVGSVVDVAEFSFSSPREVPLFWVVLAALLLALLWRRREVDWAAVVPAAGLALLAARYRREIPYFALAALPVVHRALTGGGDVRARRTRGLGAALLAAGALLWSLRYDPVPYRWGWGVDDRIFPVAAAGFIERERLPPRLYNHYEVGGYLLYRLAPPYGVFQDSRISAYPEAFMASLHARHGGAGSGGFLERYGVNTALVWSREAGSILPRQEWAVVYWDKSYCLLVRRAPRHAALLARLEYRFFLPWGDTANARDPRELEALALEMRRNERERGAPSATVAVGLGSVLGMLGRDEEARAQFERAVALAPGYAPAWAYLGLAQAQRGDQARAQESWRRALALDPAQQVALRGLGRSRGGAAPGGSPR